MKRWKVREVASEIWYSIAYVTVITVVVLGAVVTAKIMLEKSTTQRVYFDLNTKARVHKTIIDNNIKQNFEQLHAIGRAWKPGATNGENLESMWRLIEETDEFSSIGFADLNGDAITYKGEKIGNIGRRSCFLDIVKGVTTEKCEYLEASAVSVVPQLMLLVPVYDGREIVGVLFKSKKISQIEEEMIDDIRFKGHSTLCIADSQGEIMAVNENEDFRLLFTNVFENGDYIKSDDITREQLRNDLIERRSGKGTLIYDDEEAFVVYMPLGINDWTLFCMVNREIVEKYYSARMQFVKWIILIIAVMCGFCMIFSIFVMIRYVRSKKGYARESQDRYFAYKHIMYELNFPTYEYMIETDCIVGNKEFEENYYAGKINKVEDYVQKWRKQHPEYNFDGMYSEMQNVIKNKRVSSFESVYLQPNGVACWNKSILIPVCDSKGMVISVFVTVMENTPVNEVFDSAMAMMASTPIGLRRCYLSNPLHVEYVGQGICRMLGYTQEELNAILGSKQNYTNLLVEEDQEIFNDFVVRLSQKGGIDTCEYRMVCKNGSLLPVFDTMEVKIGADGIKYGYGVVTDISKYREAWENDKLKLEELEIQLNEARIKVSTGQMQPHFLYNALASIREIVLDDPEYASDLIFDFTTHLRACIKSMSSETLILFSQELENIKAYVNIEKMRFGNNLQVKYNIEESNFYIIPLSVQPLIENAIRHGIYERGDSRGLVEISSYRNADYMVIKVEDNGVGFDFSFVKNEVENCERDSTGLKNLFFRFEKIMHADVLVESQLGVGTCITINIPVKGET